MSWQKKILDLLEPLFALDPEELPSWELYAHGSLLSIWQLMLNHFLSDSPCTEDYSKLAEKLEPSLQAIRGQYDRDLTLAELAGISLVSEGQFCRLFKRLTGYTPFSYLNRCRILKSCEYLKDTDKKISEIASLCGYNNISYFNREFQKLMRQSPRQYRRNSTLHHPHEGL